MLMSQQFNPMAATAMELYDRSGHRLYINEEERWRFVKAALRADYPKRQFGLLLALSGCRLSEARRFRADNLQQAAGRVSFQTLKRRNGAPTREVPVDPRLLGELTAIQPGQFGPTSNLLWHKKDQLVPRSTAYRWIKELMRDADIAGKQACPKGLRHGFAAWAILSGVPVTTLQKWMGHASLETTMIYATLCGPEELRLAERMWRSSERYDRAGEPKTKMTSG